MIEVIAQGPAIAPYIIPVVGTVAVAVIGAITNFSLKRREQKVDEVIEAFENRGKLVDSLKERVDYLDTDLGRVKEAHERCEQRLAALEAR